ncbi:MAG: tail fiber protein, partial [Planctomycetaceae bacterium]|nr:tail fiber protein [Planctomycetaceae bacterium]
ALFSILGTSFGGDGRTTFGLPDLRGRVPIGTGQGPGLQNYNLGQKGGVETVTLTESNLPSHTHTVPGSTDTLPTGSGQSFENRQPYLALTPLVSLVGTYPSRSLSADEFLGSVSWFAGTFAPIGYAKAEGQLLPISQNTALFSLLGTTYGGDGRTTFGLPDLRGRMAIHYGSGPGLSPVTLGQKWGTESVSLSLLGHNHGIAGGGSTGNTGAGTQQSFENRAPYQAVNYQIALTGLYPSRNLDAEDPVDEEPGLGEGFVSGNEVLEEAEARLLIAPLFDTAIAYWQAAGIDDTQVALLESLEIEFADLSSGQLATAGDGVITLDRDASDRGWFLDLTPGDNLEFGEIDPYSGALGATDEAAYSHYDLLTAILHEQGHILGLNHADSLSQVMYGGLGVGVRKLPTSNDLVYSGEDDGPQFLTATPFLAGVFMFAGNFAVRDFAQTDGQILSIDSFLALFSLMGTTYGGDGRTTFGLPDFRGRAVMGAGNGPGLIPRVLGESGGLETTVLTINNMPTHTHEYTPGDPPDPNLDGTPGDDLFVVTLAGTDLVVTLGGSEVLRQPLANTNSLTLNGLGGDDTFDVPGDLGIPVFINGGTQATPAGDTLNIIGGPFDTVTYNFTGEDSQGADTGFDGSVVSQNGTTSTITFTGLEPLTNTGNAADIVFNLPNVVNPDVVLQNNTSIGNGFTELVGSTFEDTIFLNPTNSLTI